MRILVTNDDGINAHGIKVLEHVAEAISDDVWVVAPEYNHSGAGHSLSLRRPLRWREAGLRRFAVDGTPTDCVLLGIQRLIDGKRPDLVLSGINHGGNLGEDMTYSGTIAAAMEATLLGVRAVAFSQVAKNRHRIKWATSERWAPEIVKGLATADWARDVLVNVNFPDVMARKVQGIRLTSQGRRKIGDKLIERTDPRGERYVWIGSVKADPEPAADGTDLAAVADGWVSVTPIHLDMTHRPTFRVLAEALQLKSGPTA